MKCVLWNRTTQNLCYVRNGRLTASRSQCYKDKARLVRDFPSMKYVVISLPEAKLRG